jgi:hypothetical protein
METPGIKLYSPNFFLNDQNDLSRIAYQNNSNATINDTVNDTKSVNHLNNFDTDTILHSKESFDSKNSQLNNLQEEIIELKRKLKTIYEKEEEIHKLKLEIEKYKKELKEKESLTKGLFKLKNENKQLRDDNDLIQIKLLNHQSIQQENKLLKIKLKEFEENTEEEIVFDEEEKIQIDIQNFKSILNNRLKTYHEKHIDNLIDTYELETKQSVDKNILEKILLEVIHI